MAILTSRLGLAGIAIALVLTVIGVQTLRLSHAKSDLDSLRKANAAALAVAVQREKTAQAISQASEAQNTVQQAQIQTVTRTIIQKVPVYVTAKTNAAFPWPVGAVRLYNASLGQPDIPDAAGRPDDTSSGLGAADAAEVFIANNGACRADQERLSGLQAWIRAQAANR